MVVRKIIAPKGRGTTNSRLGEFTLTSQFPLGYRNREDVSNIPPNVLVVGSQNVLTNVSERIQSRQGYTLDGDADTTINVGTASAFDFQIKSGAEVHLRAGGLTSAANDGRLQFRYVASDGTVSWKDLITSLTSVDFNFTTYFDSTEQIRVCLMVNHSSNIIEWNGAVATLRSATVNTLTKTGSATWAQDGFYVLKAGRSVVINGTTYTYTGGETTTTLTGVSGDPSGEAVGSVIAQSTITTANSGLSHSKAVDTRPPAAFTNDLICTLTNSVYVASLTDSRVFKSIVNSCYDFSKAAARLTGEGETFTLDSNVVALIPQEENLYISCGHDLWYETKLTLTMTDSNSREDISVKLLKTTGGQGAQSQALVSKMKNNVIFVSNEPNLDELGRIENILGTPQSRNLSDPIKLDFNAYDFTGGQVFYHKYFIYIAVPVEGIVRMYNLITQSWEAPQTIPVSRFYTVNGALYGHSYNSFESYKLFDGYNDNGNPIKAVAAFPYVSVMGGNPNMKKNFNKLYTEGYISPNTTLDITINYDFGGYSNTQSRTISGTEQNVVYNKITDGSIGHNPLGAEPLGSILNLGSTVDIPKFRKITQLLRQNCYEYQIVYSTNEVDYRWELLRFGPAIAPAGNIPTEITNS